MGDHKPTSRHEFSANHEPDLTCPTCGAASVYVAEQETYFDGDPVAAFCDACDASLEVNAVVTIEFVDPEVHS